MPLHRPAGRGFTLTELLVVIAIIGILMGLVIPAIVHQREAARRAQCTGNLKQIALALHNYHATYDVFPPGRANSRIPGAGACWSFQAILLPWLEQSTLYNNLNFDLAPDGHPTNTTGLKVHLAVLACPSDYDPTGNPQGGTNYLGTTGSNLAATVWPGSLPSDQPNGILFENSSVKIRDITDGAAYTIMVAETIRSRPGMTFRTDPLGGVVLSGDNRITGPPLRTAADLKRYCTTPKPVGFEPERGFFWGFGAPGVTLYNQHRPPNDPGVDCRGGIPASGGATPGWDALSLDVAARSHHRGGVNASMVDGSIRFMRSGIAAPVWTGLGTRAGGEVLATPSY